MENDLNDIFELEICTKFNNSDEIKEIFDNYGKNEEGIDYFLFILFFLKIFGLHVLFNLEIILYKNLLYLSLF